MAKYQVGLPENFSLKVSKEELTGPATLPDYLDSDPLLERLKQAAKSKTPEAKKVPPAPPNPSAPIIEERAAEVSPPGTKTAQAPKAPAAMVAPVPPSREVTPPPAAPSATFQAPTSGLTAEVSQGASSAARSPQKPAPRRLQINLTAEAERKVGELLELLNTQSTEKITISDLAQGLILSLYDARGEINVSRLPIRGKWGTPTARSFPAALAEALREAIVAFDSSQGGNPFMKVVGE